MLGINVNGIKRISVYRQYGNGINGGWQWRNNGVNGENNSIISYNGMAAWRNISKHL